MRGLDMEVVLEGDGPEGVSPQHLKWTVDARADERSYNAMAHALAIGSMQMRTRTSRFGTWHLGWRNTGRNRTRTTRWSVRLPV